MQLHCNIIDVWHVSKSTFTWEAKWTQTGMRFHFGWKFHFCVQSALYLYSHELRRNETQNGIDFISVILTEMKFHVNRTCFHAGLKSQTGMSSFRLSYKRTLNMLPKTSFTSIDSIQEEFAVAYSKPIQIS